MKTTNVVAITSGPSIAWNPKADGETFGRAMVETEAAIYQVLEGFAVRTIAEFRDQDHQEQALKNFLDGFGEAYLAARMRAYMTVATNGNTKSITSMDKEKLNAKAKGVTKVTKSQIKAVLSHRLFNSGAPIRSNVKDYLETAKGVNTAKDVKKTPAKTEGGEPGALLSTKALCATMEGFMALVDNVIAGGLASDNPEVQGKAESLRRFLVGEVAATKPAPKKKKAASLGADLLAAAG